MSTKYSSSIPDNIDFYSVIKPLWVSRKVLFKILIAMFLLGLFFAIITPKKFTASTLFLSQSDQASGAGSSLSNLGALAGISGIGSGSNEVIPPELYPQIVSGYKFKLQLINMKIYAAKMNDSISYSSYYEEYAKPSILSVLSGYTLGLPSKVMGLFLGGNVNPELDKSNRKHDLLEFDQTTLNHFNRLGGQLSLNHNKKTGVINLSATMPDPYLAAQLAINAEKILKNEISDYKSQFAHEQVLFAKRRLKDKSEQFYKAQDRLSRYRDENSNITSSMTQNELDRLQAEYDLSFQLYKESATQLEQAEYLLNKSYPIFTVLQPVNVPINKSYPNRPFILLAFTLSGLILGVSWVYLKEMFVNLKLKVK